MVTFISQCEKNALKKTRRVLDAFANRIGNNTWQTIITQEGLNAVKKLLRKTASKNTAVSCHWIRSRSRTQLQWIVGSPIKFNHEGIVPVNYTEKDILMKYNEEPTYYYANTQQQELPQHLFAVGYLAYQLIKKLYHDNENFAIAALISGIWHDLGKTDPIFQDWIKTSLKKTKNPENNNYEDGVHIDTAKFNFDKHPRHNEVSLVLFNLFFDKNQLSNKSLINFCEHTIFWHHAKPIRKSEYQNQAEIYAQLQSNIESKTFNNFILHVKKSIDQVNEILSQYELDSIKLTESDMSEVEFELRNISLPKYKDYSDKNNNFDSYKNDIIFNSKKNILRAAVISADRKISALDSDSLETYIQEKTLHLLTDEILDQSGGNLSASIQECLNNFNRPENKTRNDTQSTSANRLVDVENIGVLKGPAGCGKTKIALEWALKTNVQKIIWICPRVQVCLGLYEELGTDEYLPDTQIEILTGEFQKMKYRHEERDIGENERFSGDIVLTTIDQVINAITTHNHSTGLIEFLNSHVVFDEFHELIKIPGLNLLFSELIEAKKLLNKDAKTLLVSATPNPYFITKILNIDQEDIIGISTFNESTYQVKFIPYDETEQNSSPLVTNTFPKGTFIISNTAKDAQLGFIQHQTKENAILFHGRFKKNDKRQIFDMVYDCFKQYGSKEFDILRSGPIVQASLNITCEAMITEITSPENWLQRLGRLDRFGDNAQINIYTTYIPSSIYNNGKQSSNTAKFLNNSYEFNSAYAWLEFLRLNLPDNGHIKLNQLYDLYDEFYQSEATKRIEEELLKLLNSSVNQLNNKLHDPISIPPSKKQKRDKTKLKASSLRGDSRYVQMAVIQYDGKGNYQVTNEYACNEEDGNQFTMSVDEIQGYDEAGDSNLISYMHKKHHKIIKAKGESYTKRYKSYLLKNEAVDINMPIYLSYTQEDLSLCHDSPHSDAIYYALGAKQSIGAISINKLNNDGE